MTYQPPRPRQLDGLGRRAPARPVHVFTLPEIVEEITSVVAPIATSAPSPQPAPTKRHARPRKPHFSKTVSWVGQSMLAATVFTCLYLISAPFLPQLTYALALTSAAPRGDVKTTLYKGESESSTTLAAVEPEKNLPNRLTIPKIGVDAEIYEGESEEVLDKGIWRRPLSSSPDRGGNTVLSAHRFRYTNGNNTFYNLDKLKVGDTFTVTWSDQIYTYKVYKTRVVPDTEVSIEDPTENAEVTLYTCTPLWTSTNRLVVSAKRVLDTQTN